MNFNVTVELLASLLYVGVLAPLLYVRVSVPLLYVWEFQGFSLDAKIVRLIVVQLAEYHLRLSHLGV
jgi:protein involved in ribonucleotide reduction